jgi:hypothetical protein
MSETKSQTLSGLSETLLVMLYLRAMESRRLDTLIKDEKAEALVAQMSYDFSWIRLLHLSEANKVVIILRNREFNRYARDFLGRHPDGAVVHIGCGHRYWRTVKPQLNRGARIRHPRRYGHRVGNTPHLFRADDHGGWQRGYRDVEGIKKHTEAICRAHFQNSDTTPSRVNGMTV